MAANPEPVTAYLGLGSNMGDRQANLERAMEYLSERLKVIKKSPVYDTEPWGSAQQPRFLNMVCEIRTIISPQALLGLVKGIESKLGRKGGHGEPRIIDIDILLYGDTILRTPELTIPHQHLAERAFVLAPLADIAPDVVEPVTGKTIKQLYQQIEGEQGVFLLEPA